MGGVWFWFITLTVIAIIAYSGVTSGRDIRRHWRIPYFIALMAFAIFVNLTAYFHEGRIAAIMFVASFCVVIAAALIWLTQRRRRLE